MYPHSLINGLNYLIKQIALASGPVTIYTIPTTYGPVLRVRLCELTEEERLTLLKMGGWSVGWNCKDCEVIAQYSQPCCC